jgi:hypothetical protein
MYRFELANSFGYNTDQAIACHAGTIVVAIAFTISLVWGEPDKGFTPIV